MSRENIYSSDEETEDDRITHASRGGKVSEGWLRSVSITSDMEELSRRGKKVGQGVLRSVSIHSDEELKDDGTTQFGTDGDYSGDMQQDAELRADWESFHARGDATFQSQVKKGGLKRELKRETLGKGGFGKVYYGFHSGLGIFCAIKEVLIQDAESEKQLKQEVGILTNYPHTNIVNYYGHSLTPDGRLHSIYLEYVPTGSIDKILAEFECFKEPVICKYTRQILSGLNHLHENNIIHRDIKGANILVTPNGDVKLADFGTAKRIQSSAQNHTAIGTPHWMAPEVVNNKKYTLSADIWSLGCTIIEMATKSPPWNEFDEGTIRDIAKSDKIPAFPKTLSPDGKEFLKLCFQRDPKSRPSAAELLKHSFLKKHPAV